MTNYNETGIPGPSELIMLPLGGCGEIGMNMTLYGHDGWWIMVDYGVTFPDEHTPGVDLIIPDPSFILERIDKLAGVVITHAHEDHIGGMPFLSDVLECPVYASPFGQKVLERKLKKQKLKSSWKAKTFTTGKTFDLGPFSIEPVAMTHSTLEAHALKIATPYGKIFHSGDWKIDKKPLYGAPFSLEKLEAIGKEDILACMCDSTNIFEEKRSRSEHDIRNSMIDVVGSIQSGRIAVTCFASNIVRIESAIVAARKAGREIVIAGASMLNMLEIAKEMGALKNLPDFVPIKEAMTLPKEKLLMIVAGCQGELRGSMTRIGMNSHRFLQLHAGDTAIFSSREIPGNEKAIAAVYNGLLERGIKIIQSTEHTQIHGSGHASKHELLALHQAINPKILIPIHGEYAHLQAHRDAALHQSNIATSHLLQNGDCAAITHDKGVEIVDKTPAGRWYIDGNRILDLESSGHRQRKALSFKGTAFLSMTLNDKQQITSKPEISLFGVGDEQEIKAVMKEWCQHELPYVIDTYKGDNLKKQIESAFKKELQSHTGRSVIAHVHCHRVKK